MSFQGWRATGICVALYMSGDVRPLRLGRRIRRVCPAGALTMRWSAPRGTRRIYAVHGWMDTGCKIGPDRSSNAAHLWSRLAGPAAYGLLAMFHDNLATEIPHGETRMHGALRGVPVSGFVSRYGAAVIPGVFSAGCIYALRMIAVQYRTTHNIQWHAYRVS